jgi:two-component system, cell cycle sensor histidine kinase and response regulator CckA
VRLNELISNLAKMLKRTIREDIRLECRYGELLPNVQADPGMMEQVLLNLVVNARDAMPTGGQLGIVTHKVSLDEEYANTKPEAQTGEFVCLSVEDTGTGIAPEDLPHIFEPFFTTKELGKGTGLGLATVYGIVKQHQGWIDVCSQVGKGTTFKVFLPAAGPPVAPDVPQQVEVRLPKGTETILLVEDDTSLRVVTRRILEVSGYKVCEAGCVREALEVWGRQGKQIALLLSDIVMPERGTGLDLAEQLRAQKPELKIILMSGYSPDLVTKGMEFFRHNHSHFLQKPWQTDTLLQTVRKSLDGP